ncbi:MFS transporter [Quisquiliibacterium transsilvanicum]|uniref:MFS family permease n=1 Tax=Quisquiliibacterium transsilvanicum TaxID=1549638 RepID=A0A7W8HJT0_9BURK|nr:MFS transporter [Quisquiliibacterium transsilvanicum]MBB5273377.1 MFS family permease [Quisquiliibacterium transsilvanicum]
MDVRRQAFAVLAFCFVTNMVSRGIGESFAVFLLPVAEEFGTDRALLTGIASVYMLATGAMSPLVGIAIDRFGPRACYSLGLAIFGTVYLLAGLATSLWQLYLLIGMAAAVGTSLIGLVPAAGLATRWFSARLPTAMGLLSAALGIGMLVFAPLAQWLIGLLGWRGTYQVMGAALLLSVLPVWLMPWRRIAAGAPQVSRARSAAEPADAWTIRRATRTPVFWALTAVMFFTSLSTVTVSVQLVAALVAAGFAPMLAATVFGVAGMASIVGMVGAGWFSERIGEKPFATISYSASIVGIGALAMLELWPSTLLLAAFVLLFGTMQGSRGPLVAVLSVRNFPGRRQSAIYGTVLLGMGTGAALGAWASGALYDLTGGYRAGYLLSALGAGCGLLLFRTVPALSGTRAAA